MRRLKLAGIDSREEATSLVGSYLQVPEGELESLPEGEYYRYQLIGLAVRSADGRELGSIAAVFSTASNDVFVVKGDHGEVLIPFVDDVVQRVDLGERLVVIELVPGLMP